MKARNICVGVTHAGRPLDGNKPHVVRNLDAPQRLLYTTRRQNSILFHRVPAVQIPIPRPLQNGISSSARTSAWLCRIHVRPLGEINSMVGGPLNRVMKHGQREQCAWQAIGTCLCCRSLYSDIYLWQAMRTCLCWR